MRGDKAELNFVLPIRTSFFHYSPLSNITCNPSFLELGIFGTSNPTRSSFVLISSSALEPTHFHIDMLRSRVCRGSMRKPSLHTPVISVERAAQYI